ncbi:MAG: YdeI/OmpD-associated family protein [Chitinophagaceae bacterium]
MADASKIKFETTLLQMGNNTGISVPPEVVDKLGAGKKPPVLVTVNDFSYRNSIAVMAGKFMIGVSAAIREQTGLKGGDKVTVQLEVDTAPRVVVLPKDLEEALDKNLKAKTFYDSLSYSNKRRYVAPIDDAKTEETRIKRIAKAIKDLCDQKK